MVNLIITIKICGWTIGSVIFTENEIEATNMIDITGVGFRIEKLTGIKTKI